MTTAHRRNFLWSFLVIGTGLAMLLLAVDVLPENVGDILQRSWPILLVIAGLNMLLIDRVRFGNWLALVLSAVVLVTIVYFAYETQADVVQTDYVESIQPVFLGDHIQEVKVTVQTLDTTVIFTDSATNALSATFTGSTESEVSISVQENDPGIVEFTITERRPNRIPNLETTGRGELLVLLPVGIPITELTFSNRDGAATINFQSLDVPRFQVQNGRGSIVLYLPRSGITISDVSIQDGDLRIVVDPAIALQVINAPRDTVLNGDVYQNLATGEIESRGGLTSYEFILTVDVPELAIVPPEEGN